jgi:glycosyltransferase involved in cell wall biosynthesis
VRRAVRVIADSTYGRHDLLKQFHLQPERVVAIPLAVAPVFSASPAVDGGPITAQLAIPSRYVLYAGTIQPRKNVELVVEAFAGLPDRGDAQLLIAGRVRPGYRPAFLTNPPPQVRYIGPVSDQELATLYRRALALCSPSSYEGFGLSLLEAMTSGCLVIAGRNSSVPELVGECGILLDELNVPVLRAALARVLSGDATLASLRERGRDRARRYTWDETARRTLAVYEEAIADARAAA